MQLNKQHALKILHYMCALPLFICSHIAQSCLGLLSNSTLSSGAPMQIKILYHWTMNLNECCLLSA